MKNKFLLVVLFSACLFNIAIFAEKPLDKEIEAKVESMLSKMTLEEKAGQMLNIGVPAILKGEYWSKTRRFADFDTARMANLLGKYGAGSIHNTPSYPASRQEWYVILKTIQDYMKSNTRLGIPVIYGIDNIHGANYVANSTLFPHQIGMAATWNTKQAARIGEITSYESRAGSLIWNFNPNCDLAFQPIWGRIAESCGEDPYLISQMVTSYTYGSQKGGLNKNTNTAVCIKHFLGYGAGANGKDRANAIIPENYLRQYYLPSFKAAIDSGAMSVMISSNAVNGMPCHINKYYITDILKGELGFNGVVISDFNDFVFLIESHEITKDLRESTKLAINAGVDIAMNPFNAKVVDYIIDLVKTGEIPMSRIDDANRRILRLKYMLNLFDEPYTSPSKYPKFGSAEFINDNFEIACEAITLLKNDSILPLKKGEKILVTGYSANSINVLNGAWSRSFLGRDTEFNDPSKQTILDAVRKMVGAENVTFVPGTDYLVDSNTNEAVAKAKDVDYIIACVGEIPASEKASDINELPLPDVQQNLVKMLAATGKPVILVMVQGRPRIIKDIEPLVKGIVMAYLPGDEGGRAIASILFGERNPSGKLPYTYPKYTGNILPYIHKKTDIRDVNWGFQGFYPQYHFGYGLSYTTFEYSDLKLNTKKLVGDSSLTISVTVKNTGKITGKEIVECYYKDEKASLEPDQMRLCRFSKIELKPGESKTVVFSITKNDLSFVGIDNKTVTEPGDFKIYVGGDPSNLKVASFAWTK
jgi:beta-glucosidase